MNVRALVLALVIGGTALSSSQAQAQGWVLDLAPFTEACRGHLGMQSMVAGQPTGAQPPIDRLCTCFARNLGDVSQSDADMLTKDLLGVTTDAERMSFGAYDQLSAYASRVLDSCMVSEGFRIGVASQPGPPPVAAPVAEPNAPPAPEPTPAPMPAVPADPAPAPEAPPPPAQPDPAPEPTPVPPASPAPATPAPATAPSTSAPTPVEPRPRLASEVTSFLNACVASPPFRGYLGGLPGGSAELQGTICACLTGRLIETVEPADFVVLRHDFSPSEARPAVRDGFETVATAARANLRSCMVESGVTPDF